MTSILVAGVGGQGVVLSSEIIARAAMLSGFDVKKTEVHGVAQRGGTVISHVRFGDMVFSPLAPVGSVDILMAYEKLEGLRFSHYLKAGGDVIFNEEQIVPTRYIGEKIPYPSGIEEMMRNMGYELHTIDSRNIAQAAGSRRAFNVVMLGALSRLLDLEKSYWKRAVRDSLPERLHDLNLKAFEMGRTALVRSR